MVMFRKNENWDFLEIVLTRNSLKNGVKDAISECLNNKFNSDIDIIHFEIIYSTKNEISILVSFAIIN